LEDDLILSAIRAKRRQSYAKIVIVVILFFATIFILLIPYGSRVETKILIRENNFELMDCYLRKLYLLSVIPEENVTLGDKTLVLSVTVGENEILCAERQNLGTGVCIIRTGDIPSTVEIGAKLSVTISLYRASELLSQTSTELIF